MQLFYDKNRKKRCIIVFSVVLVIAAITAVCGIYVCDYYHADTEAIQAFLPNGTQWEEEPNGTIVFEPDGAKTGLIFYPGGKVEYLAYLPLMQSLSERGVLCVLIEMPFNLAVLDLNAADGLQAQYPQIEQWYIGGHSLGGSMAASYLSDNADEYKGLVLLGSYSTADLSGTDLEVLSLYGSEDQIMNRESYERNKSNLPKDLTEIVIDGGCHAYFGMYGAQEGDGIPSITVSEQIVVTADHIAELMQSE